MVSVYRSVHCLNVTYIVVWTRKIFKSIGMFCHFFEKKTSSACFEGSGSKFSTDKPTDIFFKYKISA